MKKKTIDEIQVGEKFKFCGKVYKKTEDLKWGFTLGGYRNECIDLETEIAYTFADHILVTPIK